MLLIIKQALFKQLLVLLGNVAYYLFYQPEQDELTRFIHT